jgi:hypothetical protein
MGSVNPFQLARSQHTKRAPVIRIKMEPSTDGWASRVETWCLTVWNGRPYSNPSATIPLSYHARPLTASFSTIPTAPAIDSDSKVNIELSRWEVLVDVPIGRCSRGSRRELPAASGPGQTGCSRTR